MKQSFVISVLFSTLGSLAFAQNQPIVVPAQYAVAPATVQSPTIKVKPESKDWPAIVEVYGGYSYLNADMNDLGSRQSAHGWETMVSGRLYKRLALESNISGYYMGIGPFETLSDYGMLSTVSATVNARDYAFLGGPRVNLPKGFFIHALLGMDRLSGSVRVMASAAGNSFSFSESLGSQNSFAFSSGGGMQVRATHYLSIRATVDYMMTQHDVVDALAGLPTHSIQQNHIRFSIGPVFTFGGFDGHAIASKQASPSGMLIPALGLMVVARQGGGDEVVDIAPGGVASFTGLHTGDVITAIDGKSVNTPMEMAVAISDHAPGTKVVLGILNRGLWQSETVVLLATHP